LLSSEPGGFTGAGRIDLPDAKVNFFLLIDINGHKIKKSLAKGTFFAFNKKTKKGGLNLYSSQLGIQF